MLCWGNVGSQPRRASASIPGPICSSFATSAYCCTIYLTASRHSSKNFSYVSYFKKSTFHLKTQNPTKQGFFPHKFSLLVPLDTECINTRLICRILYYSLTDDRLIFPILALQQQK